MILHTGSSSGSLRRVAFSVFLATVLGAGSFPLAGQQSKLSRIDRDGVTRTLTGLTERVDASTAREAAAVYVRAHRQSLRLDEVSLDFEDSRVSIAPYGSRVAIQQRLGGVPVFRGGMVIAVTRGNQIRMVSNDLVYGIDLPDSAPLITADDAISIAHQHLRVTGKSIGEPAAQLFVVRILPTGCHLAFRVTTTREQPYGDWEVFVDARDGSILSYRDQYVQASASHFVQGTGAVYQCDPLSELRETYGAPGLQDNNDADSDQLRAARSVVTLDSLLVEDGQVSLSGPYCTVTDIEAPADPAAFVAANPDGFLYTRDQPGFEAVMVYYHATSAYKRLRELGFEIPHLRTLRLDPHGYQGQDNSHYSPSGHWISFGTGGVDDAEDADVIWHEYGHAIVYSLIPYWGGAETGALGEGYADYWAASHSRSSGHWRPTDQQYQWVFKWDGHNPYWPGRILNADGRYPFDSLSIHAAGQLWASALMGIYDDLGRDVMDRLVLTSLYYLGNSPTAQDAALAILQADRDLFGSAHEPTLRHWLGTLKNFLPRDSSTPILVVNDDGVLPDEAQRVELRTPTQLVHLAPDEHPFSATVATLDVPEGYHIQATSFADLDTSSLRASPLIVLLGGQNPLPFDDRAKRQAIIRYVQAGGRIVVEGGEVGFAYAAGTGGNLDEEFRQSVLHIGLHGGDLLGKDFLCIDETNPLFSEPHAIAPVLQFRQPGSYAQRDLDLPDPFQGKAVVLGRWSGEGLRGGMILHSVPGSGASLLIPFSMASLKDSTQASMLMENILKAMLQPTLPTTSVSQGMEELPPALALEQNYPNPFNPTTTLRFELLGADAEYDVSLEIFNSLGQLVTTLVHGALPRGTHQITFDGSALPSGVYFSRLHVSGQTEGTPAPSVRRMLLLR